MLYNVFGKISVSFPAKVLLNFKKFERSISCLSESTKFEKSLMKMSHSRIFPATSNLYLVQLRRLVYFYRFYLKSSQKINDELVAHRIVLRLLFEIIWIFIWVVKE